MLDDLRIANGHEDFDPAIEVPLHQVRASQIELLIAAVLEPYQAGVLEVPADDRPHLDAFAHAWHARPQAADSSRDEIHEDTGLRGAIEHPHHLVVGDRIDLDDDPRGASGFGMRHLPGDELVE